MPSTPTFEPTAGAGAAGSFPADGAAAVAPPIFAHLADEIGRCAAMALDLQLVFASAAPKEMDDATMTRAQSLDLLEQVLRDLGSVLNAMRDGRDLRDAAELVSACKLENVARRLQGLPAPTSADDDLELF